MKQKKITRKDKIVKAKNNVIQLKSEVQTQPEAVVTPAPQTKEEVKMPEEAKVEPKVEAPQTETPGWLSRNWKWVASGIGVGIAAVAVVVYITTGKEINVPDQINIPDQV